ncbi:bifunctional methylenetetrahydrofolate dehydrogenase/methenyltetrahydrofolate cyclohydrolase FolD [Bacillus sp. HMF5848]|uniref:bifunctional methylenetetrahydrofolate dehydrogenase/methenyltetrahydrofolate cyclohydrolase FolD n=1 Tax=Bacillus sp. HMF5848 TaxID=2495421 RepID=UPI000F7A61A3|nr:bifunctional methylenetetrahydrofolate dehydrogenase/methenyltetrahydrofolate cyclohydrolase FolD [Bacillus sp. HMF5848]RSK27794.1 bifunctional methylenetetrahydrofolate dehydrogenase/methenyltetrahydrofolate cyclohydrolase FolD [Bacillus sp. HMF5848]
MAEIVSGKQVAAAYREELKAKVLTLKDEGIKPALTVILIGDNPASHSYVKGKQKACQEVGIVSNLIVKSDSITEEELLQLIDEQNNDESVHGILVQLPLPKHINELKVIERISPYKDVDGFHPISVGRLLTGQDTFVPCTPQGILELVKRQSFEISGKHVVVIGRSNIVGKPVSQLFLQQHATVTICHSRTKNLKEITLQADILIAAVGKAHMIDGSYIKQGAFVIDVGVNRLNNGSLTGDIDFDSAVEKASYITPVPGGVGPMTITMLLANTVKAAETLHTEKIS